MTANIPQRKLGYSGLQVGAIGYGAMMMTWCDPKEVLDDKTAFSAIKAAIDAGANFINSGAFYGNSPDETANLSLLRRFFDTYPEYIDKVVLSVKGGAKNGKIFTGIDASLDNLREDMKRIHEALGDKKKVDIYQVARVDPALTIEESMKNLVTLKNEGHFSHIGVSEIHPTALRKAHAVHPIAAVEIELSIFALEPEAVEVVKVADELGIAVIAYSPLGRGLLTGKFKSPEDIPEADLRKHQPRYQGENFKINLQVVDALNEIGKKKGVSSGQIALAWLLQMSDNVIPIPGSGNPKRTVENIHAVHVKLSEEELESIKDIQGKFEFAGDRYPNNGHGLLWGKGKEE